MELRMDKVSKKFKDKKAVDNISLELTPGVWGLLGANGAGKTTLMRMIAGIMRPTSGQVLYDGVPIQTLGEGYRDVFGFLPQEFGFYPEFTVKDYLAYVAALKGLPERESRKRIRELLERVSLTDVYNKKIARLSGGMKRRVGIAQALLNDPEVLILDEPTGGLDPGERVRFRNLLSEFAHDRIVLISTHIVSDVEYIATCHAIIRGGKLIATGTTEELVRLVEGKVWSCTISARDVMEYESRLPIISLRNENDGSVSIRYLAERPCNDSPGAQQKAVEMYRNIKKPFEVYPGMNSTVLDYQNIMGFLVLLLSVVIAAPVFSSDYQSGADDILRCTRYGRVSLGVAKLSAALLISGAAFVLCAAAHILVADSLFGWECTRTSVQMMYSIVALADMDIGGLQLLFAVAGLLSVLASVSFTLFLSARCKTTMSSLAASLVLCIAPAVISMTAPGALGTWLCSILPASGTSIQANVLYAITDFQFLNLAGLSVWTPYAMIGACMIEIPLFAFLAVRSYCRHALN